jgi:hypothetical protein
VQLGKRTNQQFVQIPHARFIDQLTYKARLVGIEVVREARALYQQGEFPGPRPAAYLSGGSCGTPRVHRHAHGAQLVPRR